MRATGEGAAARVAAAMEAFIATSAIIASASHIVSRPAASMSASMAAASCPLPPSITIRSGKGFSSSIMRV